MAQTRTLAQDVREIRDSVRKLADQAAKFAAVLKKGKRR